jgi:hypothetical protein
MANLAVQFRGVENSVEALRNIHVACWSLWTNKNMIEKYEGEDEVESVSLFEGICKKLRAGASTAIYTLRTYDELPPGGHIKSSTEPDRSFNFCVYDYGEGPQTAGRNEMEARLNQRLDSIESKLAAQDDNEEGEEKIGSVVMDWVNKFMEMPEIRQRIAVAMGSLLDKFLPMSNNSHNMAQVQSNPASIGGVPDEEQQLQLINNAIQRLYQIDKKLGNNLIKVAEMAEKNPGKYNMLIGML